MMEAEKAKALEMALAPGGSIKQVIVRDHYYDQTWEASKMIMFNLQLFNAGIFESLSIPVPPTPVTATTYAAYGYPFFELDEEPSGIAGDFPLNTVGELDQAKGKNHDLHKAEAGLSFSAVKIGSKSTAQNVPCNGGDSLDEGDTLDHDGDLSQESLPTAPGAVKLNVVDQKSIFLPIRLLEKECQNEDNGKVKRKRSSFED